MIIRGSRTAMLGLGCALATYTFGFGLVTIIGRSFDGLGSRPFGALDVAAVALFVVAFVVGAFAPPAADGRLRAALARPVAAVGVVLPIVGALPLDPVRGSYASGAWYVCGTACLAAVLLIRGHRALAWAALGVLVVHTVLWAGPYGLIRFGVFAIVLLVGSVEAGARAVRSTEAEIASFSIAERGAMEWRIAQEAHHFQREVRLAETNRVGADMLHRIIDAGGRLGDADRRECRVLEQTIRDEIRGRRLLNDAVRRAVIAARRRGAFVQLLDDGGLDDIDPVLLEPVLDQVAAAVAGITSDRIIIRTAPKESARAITVVGVTTDPIAAALGLDDDDEQVDLWLELDRPALLPA